MSLIRLSVRGKTHGADFHIHEPQHAYLTPAKLLAMTAIDLLYDEAANWEEARYAWSPQVSDVEHWNTQPPPS